MILIIPNKSYFIQKNYKCNYNFKVYMQKNDSNGFEIVRSKDSNNRMIHYVEEIQIK